MKTIFILILLTLFSCAHNGDKWAFHKRTIEAQKLYNVHYQNWKDDVEQFGKTRWVKAKGNRLSVFKESIKNYGDKTSKRQIPSWKETETFEKQMRIWENEPRY